VPEGLIYHYTDLRGLLGILDERKLWATDIRYLNDTSEGTYGLKRLHELVGEVRQEWKTNPEVLSVFANVWPSDGSGRFRTPVPIDSVHRFRVSVHPFRGFPYTLRARSA
jgi:hypothetical protein